MDISPVYHNSRPEGVLPQQETAAFDLLDSLGIGYERVTHEEADTMEKCDSIAASLVCAARKDGGAARLLARLCKRIGTAQ